MNHDISILGNSRLKKKKKIEKRYLQKLLEKILSKDKYWEN